MPPDIDTAAVTLHGMERGITEKKYYTIEYPTGYITLELYSYFDKAATSAKLKAICKLIGAECIDNKEKLFVLKTFFESEIEFFKQYKVVISRQYREIYSKRCDTQRLVETRKRPSGVYLTAGEYKKAKEDLKNLTEQEKDKVKKFKNADRQLKRYTRFLDTVNAFIDKNKFGS